MNREFKTRRFAGIAFLAIMTLTSGAGAQIGGPKDIKPARTDEKGTVKSPKAPESLSQQFDQEGIRIDFSVQSTPTDDGKNPGLVAGADAVATFRITDARTGQPIAGLRPSAWISSRAAEQAPNEAECKDKIRSFVGGRLSVRADIDLNSYLLLTLNHDNTITFINPLVSFNITKLENIISLPGKGADWVLAKNRDFLYVTLPGQSQVVVINTVTRKIVGTIPTGEKSRPVRIALQPDGRHVWVGLDGSPQVAVIDTATNKLVGTVAAGAGLHNIAFTADGRFAYVTNSAAGSVTAIDIKTLSKVAEIAVGNTPVPVAHSSASGFVYVAAINGESISVIDPARQQVIATIPARRGIVAMHFEPGGRFGFAVNQVESTVSVFDASTNAVVSGGEVVKGPDQVTFTRRYAYIRGTGSEKFSLIDVGEAAKGKFAPVDIQAGRLPASELPEELGVAGMIAPSPEGNGVMIANTPDQMVYYYVEGMMAPMGTIRNYKRRPHGVLLLDRSLSETATGVYSSPIKLKAAGRFDVPLLIDQPRISKCFQLAVGESADGQKATPRVSISVEASFKGRRFSAGDAVPLRFKIIDAATRQHLSGLTDVRVLVFEPPGIWQQRQWAKEVGDGVYEVTQTFPRAALYNVMISVASRGGGFADLPLTPVTVVGGADRRSEIKKREAGNE